MPRRRYRKSDSPPSLGESKHPNRLHLVQVVRKLHQISLRSLARSIGVTVAEMRELEHPTSNLTIKQLRQIGKALVVPVADLLEEPGDGVNPSVQCRMLLLRLTKMIARIMEEKMLPPEHPVLVCIQNMRKDILEFYPEFLSVAPWYSGMHGRDFHDLGRSADNAIKVPKELHRFLAGLEEG